MPWIGPASRSCREGRLAAPLPRLAATAAFLAGRDAAAAGFFRLTVFFTEVLPDFLVLADFADGLAAGFLRAADFPALFADFLLTFFVTFFLTDFFDADFSADFLEVAGFFRAPAFFLDAFFAEDFFPLTLRFLPAAFLLAVDFREAVVFLPVPARFCFLLAAFFAGMFHSCRSEKNAELYIGCPNMEAYLNGIFLVPGTLFCPEKAAFMIGQSRPERFLPGALQRRAGSLSIRISLDVFFGSNKLRKPESAITRSPMSDCRDNRFMRKITLH